MSPGKRRTMEMPDARGVSLGPEALRPRILLVCDRDHPPGETYERLRAMHHVVVARDVDEALTRVLRGPAFEVIYCDLPGPAFLELQTELERYAPHHGSRVVHLAHYANDRS